MLRLLNFLPNDGVHDVSEIEARCKLAGLIHRNEREGKRCFFCDSTLSVKYIVEVDMPAKAPTPFRVHSCNKCALVKIR